MRADCPACCGNVPITQLADMGAFIVGGFVFVFCFAAALPLGRNVDAFANSVLPRVP